MPTRHEAIATALVAALDTHTATVTRQEILPARCPDAGLLNVVPGDPSEAGYRLGTGVREWQRDFELEHVVRRTDDAERDAALDALLVQTGALLHGQSLGGLVDHLELGPPLDADDIQMEGAASIKGAMVTVTVFYETSDNPMETQS